MSACTTCPHGCVLGEGQHGRCHARIGANNQVVPEAYGRITSLALDPIEKKPISCWRGGSMVLSLGGYGCNMRCPFCQNASIAQAGPNDIAWRTVTPEEVVQTACNLRDERAQQSAAPCIGIAFTYNEPLITWEFVRDTAQLAHDAGLVNVLVTNGMAHESVIKQIAPLIDAVNIDLKCFTEEGYRTLGGSLSTVKRSIQLFAEQPSCHVEVTTLVVPGFCDDDSQMHALASWLANVDARIPLHLTRFFPQHEMTTVAPTPRAILSRLQGVALSYLDVVLLGNV